MTDTLRISALKIATTIGIHPWEQRISQTLLLDIDIPIDVSACQNDLQNTLDYDALCQCVTTFVASRAFTLIETVAESVANLIKQTFQVNTLTITVSKPHAIPNAGNISIIITR
jgi:7,8-dihydroneopterin aldolase/epimerase/oxygenase